MAQACNPPCFSYKMLHQTLENFVQGPWFVLFYLTWGQDYQTFSQLFFVLCEMFLFLEFSSDLWILMLLLSPNLSATWFSCAIATFLLVNLIKVCCHNTLTFCTQFQLSSPFEISWCISADERAEVFASIYY